MKPLALSLCIALLIVACKPAPEKPAAETLSSPSGKLRLYFDLSENGTPRYSVAFKDKTVIDTSLLGFTLENAPAITGNFKVVKISTNEEDETWEMPWGEQKKVRNHYHELQVELKEKGEDGRPMKLYFRAYDDGMAFRYEFAKTDNADTLLITDENSEFKLTGDHTTWWTPGDWDIYEHTYNETKFSAVDAISKRNHPNLGQTFIPENSMNTPVTMKTEDGVYLAFHEATLVNYSDMTLRVDAENLKMTSGLVGSDRAAYKAKVALPFSTPWRVILITDKATDLLDSKTVLNLNEPNKLGDVSWFKPTKYVGIWWAMHLDINSWDLGTGRHGATTERAKEYIDFAAENGIGAVLVEGWNVGWNGWKNARFTKPYPDYDIEEVVRYGREKGVDIIMHHETYADPANYDRQLDSAFQYMKDLGLHVVKTGYVGHIKTEGEYHHGQYMVNHYNRVYETAAKYDVAVNAHEPIKATGMRRTYPNMVSREGMRGQEFNAWGKDGGNPPSHLATVAYTRMLGGPFDFTPGIFQIKLDEWREGNQINTTLAQQLALYVVIYSPVQMAADLPEHYRDQPAFQFIRDVAVDWDTSFAMNGEVGDYVTFARKAKQSGEWFIGSITDENARDLELNLSFLESGKTYTAQIYKDGPNAHWDNNPTDITIEEMEVSSETVLPVHLAEGGGVAIRILEKK
ncbi:MAG: alpha-glucosidase [Owenweeksia sp.]|nr:alpha-glucosidase [Owenweeksia sp.]MBF99038.1 alpha-glucosidase [Owenweeksia sp.]|tara:strand:+ start:3977 stop:6037 length:2061 start_codon:yes stop_codon:yes gene_type:complete